MKHKRVSNIIRGHMRGLCYAIHSSGRQGFFNLRTGKYVPVEQHVFNAFKTYKQHWVYTHCAILEIAGDEVIKTDGTQRRLNLMDLSEHYELAASEVKALADQQNSNHLRGTISITALPGSPAPSSDSLFKMLGILRGDFDKKTDGGNRNG